MVANGLNNSGHPKLWFKLTAAQITMLSVAIPMGDWLILQVCSGALNTYPHSQARFSWVSQSHLATGCLQITSDDACPLAGSPTHLLGLLHSLYTSTPPPTSIQSYLMVCNSTLHTSTITVRLSYYSREIFNIVSRLWRWGWWWVHRHWCRWRYW